MECKMQQLLLEHFSISWQAYIYTYICFTLLRAHHPGLCFTNVYASSLQFLEFVMRQKHKTNSSLYSGSDSGVPPPPPENVQLFVYLSTNHHPWFLFWIAFFIPELYSSRPHPKKSCIRRIIIPTYGCLAAIVFEVSIYLLQRIFYHKTSLGILFWYQSEIHLRHVPLNDDGRCITVRLKENVHIHDAVMKICSICLQKRGSLINKLEVTKI